VIHHPDSLGLACKVEQRAVTLPARQGYIIINFTNYNLGPLDPPCEITGGVGTESKNPPSRLLRVAPNPSAGLIEVSLPHPNGGLLMVYNAKGERVESETIASGITKVSLDLGQKPSGLYSIVLYDLLGKRIGVARVSVVR